MKHLLCLFVVLNLSLSFYANTDTPGTKKEDAAAVFEVKPDQSGFSTKINFDLKADYIRDSKKQLYTNNLLIDIRQTLSNNFLADVSLSFVKPFNSDSDNVTISIEKAKFQYVNNFIHIALGRAELTKTMSTLNYFGPYLLGGQRYVDMASITIPLFLKAGVPELEELELPPMAFSFYYFPAMLTSFYTEYNGTQDYFLGQARINYSIMEWPSQFIINVGKSSSAWFNFSNMSGNVGIELSANSDLFNLCFLNLSFAAQNVNLFSETAVAAAGLELHNFKQWIFVIDNIIFEMQFPLGSHSPYFDPQASPWFLMFKNKIDRFRYGFIVTNSSNDYTLKNAYNPSATEDYGKGNVYAPERIYFENEPYEIAYYVYIGYDF